jgi:putative transposase
MEKWHRGFPELAEWMEETLEDALAIFAPPEGHRKRMRTNNGLERFHEKIRSRTRAVRIFLNRASCLRVCSALAIAQHPVGWSSPKNGSQGIGIWIWKCWKSINSKKSNCRY